MPPSAARDRPLVGVDLQRQEMYGARCRRPLRSDAGAAANPRRAQPLAGTCAHPRPSTSAIRVAAFGQLRVVGLLDVADDARDRNGGCRCSTRATPLRRRDARTRGTWLRRSARPTARGRRSVRESRAGRDTSWRYADGRAHMPAVREALRSAPRAAARCSSDDCAARSARKDRAARAGRPARPRSRPAPARLPAARRRCGRRR